MKRTFIADVKAGEKVKIAGFVENCRNKKARAFLVIRDITGKVQVYVEKEGNEELATRYVNLPQLNLYKLPTTSSNVISLILTLFPFLISIT